MHDILRHIVLATGDEYLRAGNVVGTIRLRFCLSAHHAQVSTRMRFRQSHSPGPLTAVELCQIRVFLLR